jgi:uncharacterized protein
MSTYALIIGASQGLGKYLALELAKRNYNLLLVARSALALEAVKKEIISIHAGNNRIKDRVTEWLG